MEGLQTSVFLKAFRMQIDQKIPFDTHSASPFFSERTRLLWKHFFRLFLPAVLVIGFFSGLLVFMGVRSERIILEAHELTHVRHGKEAIKENFREVTSDILFLADFALLQDFFESPDQRTRTRLAEDYLNLARSKKLYDQVRYLDATGMEAVRVNFQDGDPFVVPPEQLQDKSNRYYFAETFTLEPGEIFVSPFDLNIEHDRIERPLKPMIRFGMSVFDKDGTRKGIVLLNYFGSILLEGMKKIMEGSAHEHTAREHVSGRHSHGEMIVGYPILLNSEGYWLLGLREEDEWGFMFGSDRLFAKDFPAAWQTISGAEHGQILTKNGMFTFDTIYPLQEGHVSATTGSPLPFSPSERRQGLLEYSWKIVSYVGQEDLDLISWNIFLGKFWGFSAIVILLLPVCWYVGRIFYLREQAHERIARLNLLKEDLLSFGSLDEKLKLITDCVVEIFNADFARIWLVGEADRCDNGCYHAKLAVGEYVCRFRERCLHLTASSGRYTHIDGEVHQRIPFGSCKIGRIASEKESKFLTNDVPHDPNVRNPSWAKELGLQAFAGYRLRSQEGSPRGVLALFSRHVIDADEDVLLENVANTTAQVIKTSQAEEMILASRDRFQAVLDNVDAAVYITDMESYEILMGNKYVRKEFGAVEGKRCWEIIQKDQKGPCRFCEIGRLGQPVHEEQLETHVWEILNTRNGKWYECRDRAVRWIDGRLVRLQIATDITERKESEKQLQKYAATQKTLLREVNHRVKNNLSAIISMLHMEEARAEQKEGVVYSDVLHALVARIQGLSAVHSLLSASEWRPLLLSHLCEEVIRASFHAVPQSIHVDIDVQSSSLRVGSSQAHHLALILSELATNTIKHAARGRDHVRIQVKIESTGDDRVKICFRDNGPGYPKELITGDMGLAHTGLEIICGISTKTLQGEVSFSNDKGAVTTISFNNPSAFNNA